MFDGFLKPKFYVKSKSLMRITKTRLEALKKKKNAVQKYLKNDIADLLKNGLDYNAYGRAEGLLVEKNMSSCYDLILQFCGCIYGQLSVMQKQRECPLECREAVPSLMYAAARFADLPELRDLRNMFTEKYGNSLEPFISVELVEKLGANPPTKEMKLQLLHDIAQEFSIEWDSKSLDQKLFQPPPPDPPKLRPLKDDENDDANNWNKNKYHDFPKRDGLGVCNNLSNAGEDIVPTWNGRDLTSYGRKTVADDKYKMYSSSEDEVSSASRRESTDCDVHSSSIGSISEDDTESRQCFPYRFVPPPYIKSNAGKEESRPKEPSTPYSHVDAGKNNNQDGLVGEAKSKPRSVRQRNLKPPPGREIVDRVGNNNSIGMKQDDTRFGLKAIGADSIDQSNEEEKIMDGLLMHYSKKQSPHSLKTIEDTEETRRPRSARSELPLPPGRAVSLPQEPTTPTGASRGHARATSFQPDMLTGHVHPKLPDYDDLAARLAALRR